jgi:probable phosphoglycerate mutase
MSVLLVRHGEDRAAAEHRFGDEGLSERGVEQARALGRSFAEVSLRGCWVSPLARAVETARFALEGREVPMEISPSLAEGAIGDLAGLDFEEGARRYPPDFQRGRTVVARLGAAGRTAPGGESRDEFVARARSVASRLADEIGVDGDPLLVVSHGGLLNYALQHLFEAPDFGPFPMLRFAAPR